MISSKSFSIEKALDPIKEKKLLALIYDILKKNHYNPINLDDNFSKAVFKSFINELDPAREFLLQSDIEYFKKFETKIDDLIKVNDLTFFYVTFDRTMVRLKEYQEIYEQILKSPNDFFINDYRKTDSLDADFPSSKTDLKNNCRLKIKHFVLDKILDIQDQEVIKKQKKSRYEPKNFATIENESRALCLQKINRSFSNFENVDRDMYFGKFLNSIVVQYDAHSKYYNAENLEIYNLSANGKTEGLGIIWGYNNNYLEVRQILIDGPAWKDNKLEVGDLLLKVAEDNEEQIDVVGYNLNDLLKISKDKKKGSTVKYTVKKADGSIKIIPLKRELYDTEDTSIKSSIIEKSGNKFGLIYLSKFYKEIFENIEKDAAKDLILELELLKKSGIKGLIFDLRNNSGGSLESVLEIAGLFLDNVPIVQIKSSNQKVEVLTTKATKNIWEGPLIILTNNETAAASEIFVAAIQDYNRGLIIGEKSTFGQGTLQGLIDLNQYNSKKIPNEDDGAVKITEKQYYRINGESIQKKGVLSDIKMPRINDKYIFLEKSFQNAIDWNKIKPLEYKTYNKADAFEKIITNSENRIIKNKNFQLIQQFEDFYENGNNETSVNLNLEKYDALRSKKLLEKKKYEVLDKYKSGLIFKPVQEQNISKKDNYLYEKKLIWLKKLSKDINLEESVNVLIDILK